MKRIIASAIAAYTTVSELPFVLQLLNVLFHVVFSPGDPANADRAAQLLPIAIQNEILPWWLDGLRFLAGAPLLAVAFLLFLKWSDQLD